MAINIKGGASANLAEVDSNKNLYVNTPMDEDLAGYSAGLNVIHDGTVGATKIVRASDASPDFRTRVGVDTLLWHDVFNHGQFNTSKYAGTESTMTKALTGTRLAFNSGNSVAINAVARVQTYRSFPLYLSYAVYADMQVLFSQPPVAGNVCEFGFGYATTTAVPTDGVFFRLNASGVLLGVINNNSSETTVQLNFTIVANTVNHFLIIAHNDRTEFWIDDICYGFITTPTSIGSPMLSMSVPLMFREYNSSATSVAQRMEIANISVTLADMNSTRLWATAMIGMGNSSLNIPDGTAAGQTTNYANTAAPASATLSNTAAGYTTLGGQWQFVAVAGSETDYALFGYLNPAGTSLVPGKNLIVRGIRIETVNTVVAVATTATVMQWGLGVGSTGVSLATADSATANTRAPRRITLGMQTFPVGATVGALAQPLDINLDAPLMVEPGTYFHVILKMPIGTATATEIFRGTCFVNGFFE